MAVDTAAVGLFFQHLAARLHQLANKSTNYRYQVQILNLTVAHNHANELTKTATNKAVISFSQTGPLNSIALVGSNWLIQYTNSYSEESPCNVMPASIWPSVVQLSICSSHTDEIQHLQNSQCYMNEYVSKLLSLKSVSL